MGGGISLEIQNLLQGGRLGKPPVWIKYLGNDPQDLAYSWCILPQGSPLSVGNAAKERQHGEVLLPASGCSNDDSGLREGGDISFPPPEKYFPVYHDSYYTGSMSGGRKAASGKGDTAVVGVEGYGPGNGGRENVGRVYLGRYKGWCEDGGG